MNPNDVKKLLKSSISDFALPVTLFNCGPLLVSKDESVVSRERLENILQLWMDLDRDENDEIPQAVQEWFAKTNESYGLYKNHRNHHISIGKTISEICEEIEHLASDTQRISEVRGILKTLIAERDLPLEIFYRGFHVFILADVKNYRDEEMIELETLLKKEDINVPVYHGGFDLTRTEHGSPDIQFSKVQKIVDRLHSVIEKSGMQVRLIQDGFNLEKNQEDEVDIAEVKELASRLMLMTGIEYSASGYGMGPEKDVKPEWTYEINWNTVTLFTSRPY